MTTILFTVGILVILAANTNSKPPSPPAVLAQ